MLLFPATSAEEDYPVDIDWIKSNIKIEFYKSNFNN